MGGWPSKPRRTTILNQNTILNTIPDIESTADEFDDGINHRNNTPTSQLTPAVPSESNENDDINDYSEININVFEFDANSSNAYFSLDKMCEREVTFVNNGQTSVNQDGVNQTLVYRPSSFLSL